MRRHGRIVAEGGCAPLKCAVRAARSRHPRHLRQDLRRDLRAGLPRLRAPLGQAPARARPAADWAYEIIFAALLGGVIGARGYFIVQNYASVEHDLLGSIFSGSGLVWYGGAIGGALGVIAWMLWRRAFELRIFDMCATGLALGYALGRIGCQVSGDGDYGIRSHLPWAMGYPHGTVPTPPGVTVQPTPIYETLAMGLVAYFLWQLRDRVRPGVIFALYLVLSGLERLLVEFVRRNKEVLAGLTTPQLESIACARSG